MSAMEATLGTVSLWGESDGMNIPTVRLCFLKYVFETRFTSSGVTAASRSRCKKNNRQSPSALAELRVCDIAAALESVCSTRRLDRILARSISSDVKVVVSISSMVLSNKSLVLSNLPSAGWAKNEKRPGSCWLSAKALTLVAILVSTSTLSSNPTLSSERTLARTESGAQSEWAAAGIW